MADVPLSWRLGIDNISTKTNLPFGAVVDAVNIDIDRASTLSRRSGFGSVLAQPNVHDIWTSDIRGQSFAIVSGVLCQVHIPWSVTALRTLQQDAPFSYTDLNGEVICGSRYELLSIAADMTVRRMGLETPSAPGVSAAGAGGLDPGQYGVAISYLRNGEEGALSRMVFVTLTVGQGFQLSIPQPNGALPTGVRIYRTQADGDVLYRVTDIPLGVSSYLLGVTLVGRQADTYAMDRMIPGDFIRYWRGMLWVVRGNYAFFSEPLRYGVYSPRFNFVPSQNAIRLFEPVENGIWVGSKDGVYFLSGKGPKDFELQKKGGIAPIPGTGTRISAALLGDEDGDSGEYVALWLAGNGFVIGTKDGQLIEKQRRRIGNLFANTGAVVVHDRRVVAVVA